MAFTYFFRDLHMIKLAVSHLLPLVQGKKEIKIWDAGCAHGPEPYTLAILLSENMGHFAFKNIHIDATDIDNSNLFRESIENGVYPYDELKRIPRPIFEKYFKQNGKAGQFVIDYSIRNRVKYFRHDLLTLKPVGVKYSLILCKNVLLHFQAEDRIKVLSMYHQSLAPEGLLAMEQTQGLPSEVSGLFTRMSKDGQVYKKR